MSFNVKVKMKVSCKKTLPRCGDDNSLTAKYIRSCELVKKCPLCAHLVFALCQPNLILLELLFDCMPYELLQQDYTDQATPRSWATLR